MSKVVVTAAALSAQYAVPKDERAYFAGSNFSRGKEAVTAAAIPKSRVLTDLTGEFNRVILEYEAENVTEFETRMKQLTSEGAFREKMKGYTDLWMTGSREILQIV